MVRMRREYANDLHQLADMRALVREACQRAWGSGLGDNEEEALCRLELAVDEAATNIILHAYEGETGRPIELVIEADSGQACVWLFHHGRDFNPEAVAPPTFDGTREGGFGLYLIKESVDEVRYLRDDQGRCGICLVKKRT
jgi:anti-sigma regulatory factor (Ser/Thr protein kinase)